MRKLIVVLLFTFGAGAQADTPVSMNAGLAMLVERFLARDNNGDGRLSRQEMLAPRRSGAPSMGPRVANRLLATLDTNGDNHVDKREFATGLMIYQIPQRADLDGDGKLSRRELHHLGF
jgi:Ca2+-binding EF-hand superfamily protein